MSIATIGYIAEKKETKKSSCAIIDVDTKLSRVKISFSSVHQLSSQFIDVDRLHSTFNYIYFDVISFSTAHAQVTEFSGIFSSAIVAKRNFFVAQFWKQKNSLLRK